MSLHDRIKEARKQKGLTQTELGQFIGVAKTTIAGYEKNREPTAAQIGAIADALDTDVGFLLQDEVKLYKTKIAPPLSGEATDIAMAFDKADPKSKDMVRLALAEYLPVAAKKTDSHAG